MSDAETIPDLYDEIRKRLLVRHNVIADPSRDSWEAISFLVQLVTENGYPLARLLPDRRRYTAVRPLMFTHALLIGRIGYRNSYDDHYCYQSDAAAFAAMCVWDGDGEPTGWVRHPRTGRRMALVDREFDENDKQLKAGEMYVRR